MAIDTRTKRAAALGVGRPYVRTKEPDATKPEAWRIASGNAYGGNDLSAAAAGGGGGSSFVFQSQIIRVS